DVVSGQPELLEVAADGLGRDAGLAQRRHRGARGPLRELLAVRPEDEAEVDVLRRGRAERLGQRAMQRLVRPVVGAADDVRDAEVDVVDDARELVRRAAVRAEQLDALEPLREAGRGLPVALAALALADSALVPVGPEPA